jgi:small subunit ribosomal protein S20
MADKHASARKRARQNEYRRQRNASLRSALRTAVKKVVVAAEAHEIETATAELPRAIRALGKASSKGIVHKNHAARTISRLTRRVNALTAAQS